MGIKYWYNETSQENTWEKPREVIEAREAASRKAQPPTLNPMQKKMLQRAIASGAVIAPQYDVSKALTYTNKSRKEEDDDVDVTFTEDEIDDKNAHNAAKRNFENHSAAAEVKQQQQQQQHIDPEDDFKSLLQEIGVHGFSRYEKEMSKMKEDPRFKALTSDQHRRRVFETYCSTLGQPGGSTAREGVRAMVVNSVEAKKKHQQCGQASDKAAENAFKALLQERISKSDASWSDVMNMHLTKDKRWNGIDDQRKKILFRSHIESLQRVEDARKRAEHRARYVVHASEQRQKQAGRADAVGNCQALMAEVVRDSSIGWDEAWTRLQLDPQGRATHELLDREMVERVFYERIDVLKRVEENDEEEEGERSAASTKRLKLSHDDSRGM